MDRRKPYQVVLPYRDLDAGAPIMVLSAHATIGEAFEALDRLAAQMGAGVELFVVDRDGQQVARPLVE